MFFNSPHFAVDTTSDFYRALAKPTTTCSPSRNCGVYLHFINTQTFVNTRGEVGDLPTSRILHSEVYTKIIRISPASTKQENFERRNSQRKNHQTKIIKTKRLSFEHIAFRFAYTSFRNFNNRHNNFLLNSIRVLANTRAIKPRISQTA